MEKRCAHLFVEGRVQGVCYRMYTEMEATRLGLTGWVRNLPDGRVEILAEGSEESLGRLYDWCQQGPPHARVTHVEVAYAEARGVHKRFDVTY